MDKHTLSSYGWIVVLTLVLSVLLAMATPFGNFVGNGVVSIANGFVGASANAIDDENIEKNNDIWDAKLNNRYDSDSGKIKLPKPTLKIEENQLIVTAKDADTVNLYYNGTKIQTLKNEFTISLQTHFFNDGTYKIGVNVEDSTGTYSASDTGYIDYIIDNRPKIPSGAIYIKGNTNRSRNLSSGSGYSSYNFNGKTIYFDTSATVLVAGDYFPQLEDGDVYCYGDYFYIYNYRAKEFDDGVVKTYHLKDVYGWSCLPFENKSTYANPIGCIESDIHGGGDIQGADIRAMAFVFAKYNITTLPSIPRNVVDINGICHTCPQLTTVPHIPENVSQVTSAFFECTKLTGTIEVDIKKFDNGQNKYVFWKTQLPITITGSAPNDIKQHLAGTANNNNVNY